MTRRSWIAAAAIVVAALALRLVMLTERPPHHDEGVNGWMLERIREHGYYAYDPENYHGPAYFYLLAAARATLGFGLFELRVVAAVIGGLACAAPWLLRRRIGAAACLAASAVLATSPTLVYYARYAIHETLFAALGVLVLVGLLRFAASGRAGWIYGAGAALAGMIATKETTILFVAVVGAWLLAETVPASRRAGRLIVLAHPVRWRSLLLHALGVLAVMAAIHVTLFTGFFQDPAGVVDALVRSARAYFLWTDTGTGETGHGKPGTYYLGLGVRYELVLYGLALAGAVCGARHRELRAFAVVGFGIAALYSAIPYKMPWLPVSWLMLLAVPAGHGVVVVARALGGARRRVVWPIVVVAALAPALAITVRSSFLRPAEPSEQLAYVHTSRDYNEWHGLIVHAAARRGRAGLRIAVEHDAMWPLPWSLAPYRPRWFSAAGDEDVIITTVTRGPALEAKLRATYFRRQYGFREAAEPALIYFRHRTFAPWLASHGSRFAIVGRAGEVVGAR